MRVLLVEDEPEIAQFIRQGLSESGYAVDVAQDGKEGLNYALAAEYDVTVLDIRIPKMDGLALLKELRSRKVKTPVLLLTAVDGVEDRVRGLDAGADDYLVKPFAFSELLARLRALLRRPPLQMDTVLQVGDLEMDTVRREVRCSRRRVELSPREFALLEYMMRRPHHVLTRTEILTHVWNFDFYGDSNVIDVYIGYLRRKLDRNRKQPSIRTIRGVGYQLSDEVEDA